MIDAKLIKPFRILSSLVVGGVIAGQAVYRTLHPASYDQQASLDLALHPVAAIIGSLIPAIISVPCFYWMSRKIFKPAEKPMEDKKPADHEELR